MGVCGEGSTRTVRMDREVGVKLWESGRDQGFEVMDSEASDVGGALMICVRSLI